MRIHSILGVPLAPDRALWSTTKRDLTFEEYSRGILALIKTLQASFMQFRVPSSVIVRKKKGKVWDDYEKLKKLGSGAFGDVYLAEQQMSNRQFVIKCLRLTKKNPKKDAELIESFKAEFDVCRKLHHLNVVRVFEMYLDPYAIVIELAKGGDLYGFVEDDDKQQNSSEEWIAGVMEQVLGAVSYCHDHGLVHQDLKPDNILLSEAVSTEKAGFFSSRLVVPSVVVSDFGQASLFGFNKDNGADSHDFKIGDPRYASPDAWKQRFNMANDVWSVGVTLYEMLSGGILPFLGEAVSLKRFAEEKLFIEMKKAVCHPEIEPDWECLEGCSENVLDLLYWMLCKDSAQRPTAAQCLQHPWFAKMREKRGVAKMKDESREQFVVQMAHRAAMPKYERAFINVLMMNVENTRLAGARNLFEQLDSEHTGFVTMERLQEYLVARKLPKRTAGDLFTACGVVATRHLEFDDFVLACWDGTTVDPEELESLLLCAFVRLKHQDEDVLTRSHLRFMFPEAILHDVFMSLPGSEHGISFEMFKGFFQGIMDREQIAVKNKKPFVSSWDKNADEEANQQRIQAAKNKKDDKKDKDKDYPTTTPSTKSNMPDDRISRKDYPASPQPEEQQQQKKGFWKSTHIDIILHHNFLQQI